MMRRSRSDRRLSKNRRPDDFYYDNTLFYDIVSVLYDYDPYEFRDQYDSIEEAYDETKRMLSSKSGAQSLVDFLDSIGPIDYDNGLEQRRKRCIVRIVLMYPGVASNNRRRRR